MTIMQRMSDMLTRWLDGAGRAAEAEEGGAQEGQEAASQPEVNCSCVTHTVHNVLKRRKYLLITTQESKHPVTLDPVVLRSC